MKKEKINENCPCTYPCSMHGKCEECQAYHKRAGEKTACGK